MKRPGVFWTSFGIWLAFPFLMATAGASEQAARVDSLLQKGRELLETGHAEAVPEMLEEAIALNPERADLHLFLGRAFLEIDETGKAMRAFQEALELDAASAEAQTGIGEVYFRKTTRGLPSVFPARRAVSAARRATRLDSTYVPAYLLLGKSYVQLNRNYKAAVRAFGKALRLQPQNLKAARLYSATYITYRRERAQNREGAGLFLDEATLRLLEHHLHTPAFLPLIAQLYFGRGEAQKALDTFEAYIRQLPETERAFYRDVGPVATRAEQEAYANLPEADREAFRRQFWARRDLDLLTKENERLFEHYRRVWYAREHFGQHTTPWDQRGEIYVRYGDPDYRARFNQPAPKKSPAVEQIEERLAIALYGTEALDETFAGPVYPVRSNESFAGVLNPATMNAWDEQGGNILGREDLVFEDVDEGALDEGGGLMEALRAFQRTQMRPENQHHYLPVTTRGDMSIVAWESWVYTNIGEGFEITFTDEMGNGVYDYAPIPDFPDAEGSVGLHRYSQYVYHAPQAIANRTMAEVPEYYRPGGGMSGVGFSYDFATFRGTPEGKTRLEVYYGIDPGEMGTDAYKNKTRILAECAVVLTDTTYSRVFRAMEPIAFQKTGVHRWPEGAFVPNLLALEVPPGPYLLMISVKDRVTSRKGVYWHRVEVESYDQTGLRLSDIQLGWDLSEAGGDDRFRKGKVWITPMPTRAYRAGQSAYGYYEVYNLKRNAFGQTRYRLTYTIQSDGPARHVNLVRGSLAVFRKLLGQDNKPQVRVSLEQAGTEVDTDGYFELRLAKVSPGYNRLTVTVEDLNGGETASKEVLLRYKK